jgi:hypothetical protein
MLPRAAESDDNRTENLQDPGRAQALRLVPHSSPAPRGGSGIGLAFHGADDEEDWETLLTRAKAEAERRDEPSEEDEWEWAAQMQRVKAQLAHSDDDDWEAAVARARALSVDAAPQRPVARVHVGPQSERASTVHSARARMMKAPQRPLARPSTTPVEPSADGAPALYFTLPDEKPAEPAKLPEEVSKVVARSTIMPNPRTGTHAAPPAARASTVPTTPVAAKPASVEKPIAKASSAEPVRPSLPPLERTSLTAVPMRTSLAAVPPRKTVPEARRTSYLEATRASEPKPEPAPSKSKQSSPGMAALRVAATKRSTDVTPRPSQPARQSFERVSAPVERTSQPAEEPKKKDSSLVGLEAALVEQMAMAKRTGRGAPPPPPPAAYAVRGQSMPMRAPQQRSSRAPLKIPAPPARSSVPARQPLKIPPPPPPSSAKQGVPERVVSRVKNAVAALTRRGGVRG